MSQRKHVEIFTDGACSGNPGPGGYGVILRYKGVNKELSDGSPSTTNNRMELSAVIAGLSALKEPWMRNKKEPALNPDLWDRLLSLLEVHNVEFIWVKGHAGHPENERCDQLAVAQSQKFKA